LKKAAEYNISRFFVPFSSVKTKKEKKKFAQTKKKRYFCIAKIFGQ